VNHAAPPPLGRALSLFTATLAAAGSESPGLDAELILAEALGLERNDLLKRRIVQPDLPLDPARLACAESLLSRRKGREPMAYILGRKEFFGRTFAVTPATLIPRPDTELLVEKALESARASGAVRGRFADLGVGSGAIAVTLALELPGWHGTAVDIEAETLAVAARNAGTLGASSLRFVRADFRRDLSPYIPPRSLHLVASNPPYIPEGEYRALAAEVRLFEPPGALLAGPAGTELAACVVREALRALRPGGCLCMEMGWNQAAACRALLAGDAWENVQVHKDMAGHDRVISARRNSRIQSDSVTY
jgi:release factor glutamine methyltransferase